MRRFEPSFESEISNFTSQREETSFNNTETNASKDAPPSYSDVNQSSGQLPPPYPET